MTVRNFRDLLVWQKAMELCESVYLITKGMPKEELFGMVSQIRRSAISVPSNIAEGHARDSSAEFKHFLSIAKGSLAEVETQLELSYKFKYVPENDFRQIQLKAAEVSKMLGSLHRQISQKTKKTLAPNP